MLAATTAFSAPGDGNLFTQDQTQNLLAKDTPIVDTAFDGESLYILFQTGIYKQIPGSETEPALLCSLFPKEQEGTLAFTSFQETQGALGENARWLAHHLFVWQGNL